MIVLLNPSAVRRNISPAAETSPTSQATGLRSQEPVDAPVSASAAAPEPTATSEAAANTTNGRHRSVLLKVTLVSVNGARLYIELAPQHEFDHHATARGR
jgi:3'-phosphoadenosine 5'-phosphosulfate (PAPS) 3'-phosphatase